MKTKLMVAAGLVLALAVGVLVGYRAAQGPKQAEVAFSPVGSRIMEFSGDSNNMWFVVATNKWPDYVPAYIVGYVNYGGYGYMRVMPYTEQIWSCYKASPEPEKGE